MVELPEDLKEAIRTLHAESIGDHVYAIRERELQGWEGPRVTAWSKAAMTIERYAKEIESNG